MRFGCFILLLCLVLTPLCLGSPKSNRRNEVSANAVIAEMNFARQNPIQYAKYIAELRTRVRGNCLILPQGTRLRMKEGTGALDDALRFLQHVRPQPPLTISNGLCHAAADHCADQASGRLGHGGSDTSNPARRIARYGIWGRRWAENISYGKTTAREIVLTLIVDDGLSGRKHRKNIFNSDFNYAGAAYGPHSRYHSVCSIDFAGTFLERSDTSQATLVARE